MKERGESILPNPVRGNLLSSTCTAIRNEIYSRRENRDLRNPTIGLGGGIFKKERYQILILE